MTGMINGAAFENNAADYHDYRLVPGSTGSPFAAGNTDAPLDGFDLGVVLNILDSAFSATKHRMLRSTNSSELLWPERAICRLKRANIPVDA